MHNQHQATAHRSLTLGWAENAASCWERGHSCTASHQSPHKITHSIELSKKAVHFLMCYISVRFFFDPAYPVIKDSDYTVTWWSIRNIPWLPDDHNHIKTTHYVHQTRKSKSINPQQDWQHFNKQNSVYGVLLIKVMEFFLFSGSLSKVPKGTKDYSLTSFHRPILMKEKQQEMQCFCGKRTTWPGSHISHHPYMYNNYSY